MPASYRLIVGDYKFGLLTHTGSKYEDGVVIPRDQELTEDFLEALKEARNAYKYFWALSTLHHIGYTQDEENIDECLKLIQEAQNLGILELDEYEKLTIDKILNPEKYMTPERKPERVKETGYIYLVSSTDGFYKIGRAKELKKRIDTLGVTLPFPIELLHSIKSDDYVQLEKDLHARFNDKRGRGEWFNLSPDDIEYIKGL